MSVAVAVSRGPLAGDPLVVYSEIFAGTEFNMHAGNRGDEILRVLL